MDYDDIKEKILGWFREKESFDDKDIYFLFKDLCEETWELVKGGEVEVDESLDPDSLEGFGEEPLEEEGVDDEDDVEPAVPVKKPFKKIDLDADEELDDEGEDDDEDDVDKPDLPGFDTEKPSKPPVYAKKPRIKPK